MSNGGTLECAAGVLKVPTINHALKELRVRFERIITLAIPPECQSCFHPYGISYIRLRTLGIASLVPGIEGRLCLPSMTGVCSYRHCSEYSWIVSWPQERRDDMFENIEELPH